MCQSVSILFIFFLVFFCTSCVLGDSVLCLVSTLRYSPTSIIAKRRIRAFRWNYMRFCFIFPQQKVLSRHSAWKMLFSHTVQSAMHYRYLIQNVRMQKPCNDCYFLLLFNTIMYFRSSWIVSLRQQIASKSTL